MRALSEPDTAKWRLIMEEKLRNLRRNDFWIKISWSNKKERTISFTIKESLCIGPIVNRLKLVFE